MLCNGCFPQAALAAASEDSKGIMTGAQAMRSACVDVCISVCVYEGLCTSLPLLLLSLNVEARLMASKTWCALDSPLFRGSFKTSARKKCNRHIPRDIPSQIFSRVLGSKKGKQIKLKSILWNCFCRLFICFNMQNGQTDINNRGKEGQTINRQIEAITTGQSRKRKRAWNRNCL